MWVGCNRVDRSVLVTRLYSCTVYRDPHKNTFLARLSQRSAFPLQNLALTSPFSNSPTIPQPANVHLSLTSPSVTAPRIIPLRA